VYRLQNLKIRLKKMNIVIVVLCVCVRNKYRIFLAFCFMIKLTPRRAAPPPPANITRRHQKLISSPTPPYLNIRFAAADQISSAWGSTTRHHFVNVVNSNETSFIIWQFQFSNMRIFQLMCHPKVFFFRLIHWIIRKWWEFLFYTSSQRTSSHMIPPWKNDSSILIFWKLLQ